MVHDFNWLAGRVHLQVAAYLAKHNLLDTQEAAKEDKGPKDRKEPVRLEGSPTTKS